MLLLGCDMPLVSEAMVGTVLSWSARATVVVPMGSEGPEPLCALYRLACASEVERRLRSEDRSLRGLVGAIGPVFIGEEAVAEVSDPRVAFLNVNTAEDRDRAETLLESHRVDP